METKTIVLPDGKKVNLWKLNFGFRSDLQGAVSKIKGKDMEVDIGNVQIMTLVYGIYDSEDLGIVKPNDIEMGLNTDEITARQRKIRALEVGGDLLYKEINNINKDIDPALEKN